MTTDKERAEFEAWFMAVHLLPESDWFKRGDDGRYQYVEIQQLWEALQSIHASSANRIAELEAEVAWCKRLIRDECINPQQLGAIDDEAMKGGA